LPSFWTLNIQGCVCVFVCVCVCSWYIRY
jgi:hypothetical protein